MKSIGIFIYRRSRNYTSNMALEINPISPLTKCECGHTVGSGHVTFVIE